MATCAFAFMKHLGIRKGKTSKLKSTVWSKILSKERTFCKQWLSSLLAYLSVRKNVFRIVYLRMNTPSLPSYTRATFILSSIHRLAGFCGEEEEGWRMESLVMKPETLPHEMGSRKLASGKGVSLPGVEQWGSQLLGVSVRQTLR